MAQGLAVVMGDPSETLPLLPEKRQVPVVQAGEAPARGATGLQLSFNIIACGLGTGIFTLPWSMAGASVVPAVAIVGGVLALNAWTISIIVAAAERHQVFDLGGLLGRLPGNLGRAEHFVNAAIWFTMYLCLVGYLIVFADCVQSSGLEPGVSRPALVVLAALVVLPLCFMDQARLSMTSLLSVTATITVLAVLAVELVSEELAGSRPPVCFFGASKGCIAMVSAMMQTVVIQMCVLPMYAEMRNRNEGAFNRVVAVSFSALFVVFAAFGMLGFLTYGRDVSSNVIKNLPTTGLGIFARLCAAASVLGVFPIIMSPMLAPLRACGGEGGWIAAVATICITVAVTGAALRLHDLGQINVVNGALSMGVFVAIVPCLIGLYLLGPLSEKCPWRWGMLGLAVCGTALSVLGLVMTNNYTQELQAACVLPGKH